MSWDVPTAEDCPFCGQTMFKKSGKGQKKTFCINEKCENFTPEEQRGGWKKKTETKTDASASSPEEPKKVPVKKAAAKKTAASKTTAAKKTTTAKKSTAKKTTAAKKTTTKKTTKKSAAAAEETQNV